MSESDEREDLVLYIGRSSDVGDRLRRHERVLDFGHAIRTMVERSPELAARCTPFFRGYSGEPGEVEGQLARAFPCTPWNVAPIEERDGDLVQVAESMVPPLAGWSFCGGYAFGLVVPKSERERVLDAMRPDLFEGLHGG